MWGLMLSVQGLVIRFQGSMWFVPGVGFDVERRVRMVEGGSRVQGLRFGAQGSDVMV